MILDRENLAKESLIRLCWFIVFVSMGLMRRTQTGLLLAYRVARCLNTLIRAWYLYTLE
jgi:hypothetical protein